MTAIVPTGQTRRRALEPKDCDACGKLFAPPRNASRREWARRRFCSVACAHEGRTAMPVRREVADRRPEVFQGRSLPCRGSTADFYPVSGERAVEAAERLRGLALVYCADCPIRAFAGAS